MTLGMKRRARIVWLAWCLAGAVGCATAQARTPGGPALTVPEPPPRTIEAEPEPEPAETGPTPVIVPARPPARPVRPPARPDRHPTDPAPVTPPVQPADAVARPAETAAPARTLQSTDRPAEAEARIRGVLADASRDLAAIDARKLSAGARSQYDSARRFIAQADDALKQQNLVFAGQLASKAASLAAALRAR